MDLKKKPKIFICGHGRHGKDTVAEILRDEYGFSFASSSLFCMKTIVQPYLATKGITYNTDEDCYNDRVNHRTDWFDAIRQYTEQCPHRLSKEIFERYDLYVGIRSREEFLASRHLADISVFVDALGRVPDLDPTCKIFSSDCDIVLDNNGSLCDLKVEVDKLVKLVKTWKGGNNGS